MRYWLTFDLGFRGNYEELYGWLDKMEAKECGDSCATFSTYLSKDEIRTELSGILDKNARIYLIFRKEDGVRRGRFIIGKRKLAPWSGYARVEIDDDDWDEDEFDS